jgi:hypothetical protein
MSVIGNALLALGMLLTTASQFRIGNLPIGPGELCLFVWLFFMLVREMALLGFPLTLALSRLLIFWTIFAMSQCLGLMTGVFIGEAYDSRWLIHDAMAYSLLFAVSCMSVVEPGARSRLRQIAWLLVTFAIPFLCLQIMTGWKLIEIPQIQPWYWDRFRGWSENPNQLSLLCGVLGLISLHLAETATRPSGRALAIACSILPIYVGRMTKSDTFTLALMASVPIFIVLKLHAWLLLPVRKNMMRVASAWIAVIALPLLVASIIPLGVFTASNTESFAKDLAKDNGNELKQESDLRFFLWSSAIRRGIETSMLGLGPGPHLDIPTEILVGRMTEVGQPQNIEHPEASLAPNFEAHNSFLDLFTQGGIIALLSFIWILGVAAFAAYRTRRAGLVTLICGLCIYCMTGNVVRHPIFWFSIALCLVADGPVRAVTTPMGEQFQQAIRFPVR